MTTFQLDTKTKRIKFTADLSGETSPIEAEIHYAMEPADQGSLFVPLEIHCSREWLTVLAPEFVKTGQARFAIPQGLPSAAAKILGL